MIYLTKQQLAMLKRSSKEEVNCDNLSPTELEIIFFLEQNSLVKTTRDMVPFVIDGIPNPYKGKIHSASISEKGKSFLIEKSIDSKRYRNPFIVSVISIIIAALALSLSVMTLYLQLR